MNKLMIYNVFYPDSARDNNGKIIGELNQGCLVPVVGCPNQSIGDRCPIGRCFACKEYVRHDNLMLQCKYSIKNEGVPVVKPGGNNKIEVVSPPEKPDREPTGVFLEE